MKYLLLSAALLSFAALPVASLAPASPAASAATAPVEDVAALVKELKSQRDDADPALIEELAGVGTREAMEGLLDVYDSMSSIYMRLEVVKALATYDKVESARQPALEKVANIATESEEPELRDGALEALGSCRNLGRFFLQQIVDSAAEDPVRIKALRLHVAMAQPEDHDWYLSIYNAPPPSNKKPKKGEEVEPLVWPLAELREMAFDQVAPTLEVKELKVAAEDMERDGKDLRKDGIRRRALSELHRRGEKAALTIAKEVLKSNIEKSQNRMLAAEIVAADQGPRVAKQFIDLAGKDQSVVSLDLVHHMADLLREMGDAGVDKKIAKSLGKGKERDLLFQLRAMGSLADEKLEAKVVELLEHESGDVRQAAAGLLGRSGSESGLAALQKLIDNPDERPETVAAAVDAVTEIRKGDADWVAQLVKYAGGQITNRRNAAVMQLGALDPEGHVDTLIAALGHKDWSTRLAALKGLERAGNAKAVGAIVDRMQSEEGRMSYEFADVLWRLSGEPYRTNARAWKGWWEKTAGTFSPISEEELAKREEEERNRRLRQVSKATFFGIRIRSHRVIFIIDISGSMNDTTRGIYQGVEGDVRIEVAKRELARSLDALEQDALFNIITFSGGVERWLDDGVVQSQKSNKEEAKEWVAKLGAGGGTNLYGALKNAFEDPDVDTIFVLSDGEPSVGDVIDPAAIREHVASWNEHRNIVINSIAVGGTFYILEWLAEDTGGTHVKYP